jgi:putative membrane protein
MRGRRRRTRSLLLDAALGAGAGLVASWVMERAQARIMAAGSEETKAREKRAQGDLEPATYRAAERAARLVGKRLPEDRKAAAGEVVHYATGAVWGALFGLLARRLPVPIVAAGAAWGTAVWLVSDELLVPALGFSRSPAKYPPSTHAKALASHLVYGTTTEAGYRALRSVIH